MTTTKKPKSVFRGCYVMPRTAGEAPVSVDNRGRATVNLREYAILPIESMLQPYSRADIVKGLTDWAGTTLIGGAMRAQLVLLALGEARKRRALYATEDQIVGDAIRELQAMRKEVRRTAARYRRRSRR